MMRWLLAFMLIAVACNVIAQDPEPIPASDTTGAVDVDTGAPPTIQIVTPQSGQQVRVNTPVEIQVLARDARGVTRLQLSNSGQNLNISTKSFPEAATESEALLGWTPDREGTFELSVIAYRGAVPSDPATITLQVVGANDAMSNPVTGQVAAASNNGSTTCNARVLIGNLRMREGPGTGFTNLGNFDLNEQLTVIGQNSDGSWVKIRRTNSNESWVINNSEWIELTGACSALNVVES